MMLVVIRETSRLMIFMARDPCVAGKADGKPVMLLHTASCFASVLLHLATLSCFKLLLTRKFQLKGYSETF